MAFLLIILYRSQLTFSLKIEQISVLGQKVEFWFKMVKFEFLVKHRPKIFLTSFRPNPILGSKNNQNQFLSIFFTQTKLDHRTIVNATLARISGLVLYE